MDATGETEACTGTPGYFVADPSNATIQTLGGIFILLSGSCPGKWPF